MCSPDDLAMARRPLFRTERCYDWWNPRLTTAKLKHLRTRSLDEFYNDVESVFSTRISAADRNEIQSMEQLAAHLHQQFSHYPSGLLGELVEQRFTTVLASESKTRKVDPKAPLEETLPWFNRGGMWKRLAHKSFPGTKLNLPALVAKPVFLRDFVLQVRDYQYWSFPPDNSLAEMLVLCGLLSAAACNAVPPVAVTVGDETISIVSPGAVIVSLFVTIIVCTTDQLLKQWICQQHESQRLDDLIKQTVVTNFGNLSHATEIYSPQELTSALHSINPPSRFR